MSQLEFEVFNIHKPDQRDKYYPIVEKWWKDWKWPPIGYEFLSTVGVIVKHNDKYVCAGWLYQTDSLMCVSDFFISSKDRGLDKIIRKEAIKELLLKIEAIAKNMGFRSVYTSVKNPNLIKTMLELDYGKDSTDGKGDQDMTVFIKKI